MFIVQTHMMAIMFTFLAMIGWGSWANTTKLVDNKRWPFQLFYWDYSIGLVLFSLALGLTLGSTGDQGQSFFTNLTQAETSFILDAFIAGVVFNIGNLLLVAAIDLAGMAVAFPIGVGLALVLGTITSYISSPSGNLALTLLGLFCITLAIILSGVASSRMKQDVLNKKKGLITAIAAGLTMGWFASFIVKSISPNLEQISVGMLTPYTAIFIFAIGVFLSNFILNVFVMKKPISGKPINGKAYFKGSFKEHIVGIIGGAIWCLATALVYLCGNKAGYAVSYALGQCAAMVALIWGVFVWKEFKGAPKGTGKLILFVFITFIVGITFMILASK
ncbi:multidrug DMT transporter permease [Paraphotobacterium marinum]|uniref:Multidrug DMT transporter permease n=1 Tax=Paraphotobacterium marinum TaxID=1755811 RepID=A0A220VGH8_9GAMM|nr:GRP family sugar transporter [Paraphotobacterium marinum]ASK79518.1 multidrug DMT transporter permease [Paraphotobacterium marinum]